MILIAAFNLAVILGAVVMAGVDGTATTTRSQADRGLQVQTAEAFVPTAPPYLELLRARQAGRNNAICGWINGNAGSAVSCGANFYCATQQSFVGCCSQANCPGIVTKCYDLLVKEICDPACQRQVGNLVCGSTLPYCATYEYGSSSRGYGCAAATGFTATVALSITTSNGGPLNLPTSTSLSASSLSRLSPTLELPTPSIIQNANSNNKVGTGVIAGIVIGSVIAFLLAGILIFWVRKSRRKQREKREQEIYQNATQNIGLQHRSTWRSSQMSPTPGDYSYYKVDHSTGSPPLHGPTSPASARDSQYSNTIRSSSPPQGYVGPTIPEMVGDEGMRQVR